MFGLSTEFGRTFADAELQLGAAPSAVVSHAFAQKYFGGAKGAVGRTMNVGPQLVTIVGVMPPEMNYPAMNEVWMPHEIDKPNLSRTSGGWRIVARVRDGMTLAAARADLSALSRRMKQQYGTETWMSDADAVTLREQLIGSSRTTLLILLGASAFLLLIACANVVNLLVARMSARRSEIGVRLAMGASRARLAQQFLTESAVLAVTGGVLGVVLAAVGIRLLVSLQNSRLPRVEEIHLNIPVMLFAVAVSAIAAIALGLFTAWSGTNNDIRDTLSSSQRTQAGTGASSRIRQSLVVSQMALTVVLLVGAGLLGRSFAALLDIHPGYRTEHAVVLDATLPYERGEDAARRRVQFFKDVLQRTSAIPGVAKVGAASNFPLLGGGSDGAFIVLSSPDEKIEFSQYPALMKDAARSGYANFAVVDGNYFDAMNIPVVKGRTFRDGDTPESQHVGVISASLAKTKWPNEDPIGKVIQYGNMDGDLRPYTVVGIVGDVRDASLATEATPTFYAYLPQRIQSASNLHIVLQTTGNTAPVMNAARAIVHELQPAVPPVLRTMETVVATSVADRKFVLLLVAVFGGAALLLATLGVYSVISYMVTQRNREIGVRIALGAQRSDVLGLVLREGALLAVAGIVIGGIGALALTRLLKGLVFGVSTTDPIAFTSVIVLLATVALVASWLPALRAARVDPMNVLRSS